MRLATKGQGVRLLAGLVAMSALLSGCAETRQPSQEIIEDLGEPGWVLVFEGPLDDALVGANADLVRPNFSVLPSVSGWVHVWEKDSARVAVGLFYTGNELANPLAGARRLRRTMEEWRLSWTREFEEVASASVTLEVASDSGVKKWVYGANRAYVFGIGFEGVSHDLVGEIFDAQLASLPEFDPFDSIRPGVTVTYLVLMLLAFFYGVRMHRDRLRRLDGAKVEVFP
ncbi:MAG: hypothetical protein WD184_02760 [Acidimicrobiia bacterium]